ncbi:uncharacterized protein [Osmerus mordax]|uniref:uncharacterized protein n=1 Tax=Osmerus mordax TaxID=8014 RepID=UPI00351031E5
MESFTHLRKPAIRSCSLGDTVTRSHTFHTVTQTKDQSQEEEGSPRQRRITVESYVPQSKDQNGNLAGKGSDRQGDRCFEEFSTEEVCQWFISIGLPKCLPFIKEKALSGADVASVDVNTLEVLHISSLEEREQLLSAIYREIHPPSSTSQKLDSLLETLGPNNIESFTAALVSMSKSKSSPQVNCLNMNRCSVKLRNRSHNYLVQKNSQLIEITINASERIVHLRTPKETSVGKVVESCTRMLNMTEDKDLFTLKEEQGSSEGLSPGLQIGSLATHVTRQLELYLCKKEKPKSIDIQGPKINNDCENAVNQNLQVSLPGKEEKIKALNQQVDSLQHVILQVQELHQGLVAFCSELKSTEGEVALVELNSAELEARLEEAQGRLRDKRQSLQALRDATTHAAAHGSGRSEVRLLDKMKTNCQVFMEEISLVHLNRQVAHLQTALQDCQDKGLLLRFRGDILSGSHA